MNKVFAPRWSSPRLALGTAAVALVLAACSNSDNQIVGPSTSSSPKVATEFGGAAVASIQVCIDPASPSGPYSASFTTPTNYYYVLPEDMTNQYTMNDILQTSPQAPINPGECKLLFTKVHGELQDPNNPASFFKQSFTTITVTNTNPAQGGGSFTFKCIPDANFTSFCGSGTPTGLGDESTTGTGNSTINGSNPFHGSTTTFRYSIPQGGPQFVVGDLASGLQLAASLKGNKPQSGLNFWGSQWWKNNPMSEYHDNGWPSFKGYATEAGTCGGVWISRVGNSPPPPATIGADIQVIVTSNVWKNGPDIMGNIKQIIVVHQDGGYGPNPGHDGNGPKTSVVCTASAP